MERIRPGRTLAQTVALVACITSPPIALAQVYKCVDSGGHVTYQQDPCPGQKKGGRLEIQEPVSTRETPEREVQWAAAVRERNVQAGMPKAWVRKALGDPSEVRAGRPGENAIDVWGFPISDGRVLRIGFVAGNVAWFRHETATSTGGAEPPPGPESPAEGQPAPVDVAPKPLNPREQIPAGMACSDVLMKLGMPDRREIRESKAVAGAGFETRHIYEPGPSDPLARTTVVCVAGKVVSVERGGS